MCDKRIKYETGKSRIVYIGTTAKGLARISRSVAARAEDIISIRGVQEFNARIITCNPRQGVKSWHKLERGLLLSFRELYGEIPYCNTQGSRIKETDEFRYFSRNRLKEIIEDIS